MAASSVAAFWALALLLISVPGPDWAFTISSGMLGHSALPAVGGLVAGYAGITVVVAAGAGGLVASSPALLTGLTIAGGLYLTWHGAMTFARPPTPAAQPGTPAGAPARATLARGMGVSALNPKGLLLFLALLPQFTNPQWTWPLTVQLGFLGLVFTLTCAVFYLCLGSFARGILSARPAAARAVTRLSGAAMVVAGALLLVERLIGS
jgi:threonine/homoserine/homoserine lactone efflux protein